MSALSTEQTFVGTRPERRALHLVPGLAPAPVGPARPEGPEGPPRPEGPEGPPRPEGPARPASGVPGARRPARARQQPVRLTGRGRVVLAAVAAAAVAATLAVTGLVVNGGARASDHGRAGAGYSGMHQIVVRPGETLWTIASTAEPSQDPRLVIQEIMTVNSMPTAMVRAGQVLWVPK